MKRLFDDGRQIWEIVPSEITEAPSNILSKYNPFVKKKSNGFDDYNIYSIQRYWDRRFLYWPNFDSGICTDTVGLYSVTPWDSAVQIAQTLDSYYPNDSSIIVDACCGVGGNTVAFSRCINGSNVIGVDTNSTRLICAKNNSKVSGSEIYTDFVRDDAINFVSSLRGTARFVFSSPPWGGPGYSIKTLQDIPFDVFALMEATMKGCIGNNGRLVLYLPRHFPVKEAKKLVIKGTKMSKFDVTTGKDEKVIASCFLYGKPKNS